MWGLLVNPTALIPVTQPSDLRQDRVGQLVKRVLDRLTSEETRRAYRHALEMFLAFCDREGNPTLSAELVASYRVSLVGEGKSSSTVGVHLAAIKALTGAAVMAGLMASETAASINDVKGAPRRGNRIGNWLTREQAQELLSLPDRENLKGKRDYAILALLLGCGLRRTELVSEVKVGAIAQRENRWVLVDITGKGNRVRSVAVPAWVKAAIDAWTAAAGITEGKIFRAVRKGGKVWGQDLTPGAVLQIVQQYARAMGLEKLAPHDMRRTCAKLCRKRGGDLEQIKFLLGHASIQTTERYLGAEQDFVSAVNDNLGLER
jgi:site-specific recombinase XerD